jgi:tRNA-dihydrouridine synthase B
MYASQMKTSQFLRVLKEKKLFLPPLSGYTDYPFRVILASFGPPFIITEMANARAIVQKNWRTKQILRMVKGSHYNGVQLVGSIPEYMRKSAEIVQDLGFDYIDINMGCTARKVSSRGEGISLMRNEERACAIVDAVSHAVDLPVTCKLRLGVSKHSLNVLSLSQKLIDAGAAAITIHGRSGEKKFGTPLDLEFIRKATETLSAPVIANGGIYNGVDANTMLQKTGATAVMPGRGLLGNPWLVSEILTLVSNQTYTPPSVDERKEVCMRHLALLIEFYGERRAILKMRSILPHYFSTCMFLKNLKHDVQQLSTTTEVTHLLKRISTNGKNMVYTHEE